MSCILQIETSAKVCSVAVTQDGSLLFEKTDNEEPNCSARLGVFVDEAISYTDSHAIPFDAVAVSCGPGSYTGLRIGASMAKGICYARGLKLIAVPTLELLCVPFLLRNDDIAPDSLICPMIDARRMEVYAAIYDRALRTVRPTSADIVEANSYNDYLESHNVYFFGDGAEKCKDVIKHPHAHFVPSLRPTARYMSPLAEKAVALQHFADTAYFEPFYLKNFIAKKPKSPFAGLPHANTH